MVKINNIKVIISLLCTIVFLMACSNEEDVRTQTITLSAPIEIVTEQPQLTTRATIGDPGFDDALNPPKYLYIWAGVVVNKDGNTTYSYKFYKQECTADDWTYTLGSENSENQNTHYKYNNVMNFTFDVTAYSSGNAEVKGKLYAIATNKEIAELEAAGSEYTQASVTDEKIAGLVADLNGWSSVDLADLYSTPATQVNTNMPTLSGGTLKFNTIKLYHCAAKVDFQWEVAETLRPTTWVNSIKVTGLPTSCKIFDPTHNPDASGEANVVEVTSDGNKWIGREYAYVLQPASGALNYSVTFGGSSARTQKSATFTPPSLSPTYTGWYSVVATVSN